MSTLNGGPRSPREILGSSLNIWYDLSKPTSTVNINNANTIDTTSTPTVSRLFDFSGNNKHANQSTKAQQLFYVSGSVNGFTGATSTAATNMGMVVNGTLTTGARSFFIVGRGPSSGFIFWDRGSAVPGSLQLGVSVITGWNNSTQNVGNIDIAGGNSTTNYVMSYMFDTTQTYLYRNGNQNRVANSNLFTLNGNTVSLFGRFLGGSTIDNNQSGTLYELLFVSKIPTIDEYNSIVFALGAKWGVSVGPISSY